MDIYCTQEECSERIFETSIAGEIVKNLLAVANANIITDFILAESSTQSYLADKRYDVTAILFEP